MRDDAESDTAASNASAPDHGDVGQVTGARNLSSPQRQWYPLCDAYRWIASVCAWSAEVHCGDARTFAHTLQARLERHLMMEAVPETLNSEVAMRIVARNHQTRGLQTYASHRQRTMSLLSFAAAAVSHGGTASLSVLGAGNCLDLDLRELAKCFFRINLLDLDLAAVEHGFAAQLPPGEAESASLRNSVRLMAPVDLATPLASLSSEDFADSGSVEQICKALGSVFESAPADPADVVISTCVLSQMVDGLALLSSPEHPKFVVLLQALRRGHFRRMVQLLKPGGQGVFVSDLVSSESTPVLQEVSDAELPCMLAECLSGGNFFSGLNPGILVQELRSCSELSDECCDVQVHAPWRWHMGPRVYAVYAVTFRRR